jgi:hypothetical protein
MTMRKLGNRRKFGWRTLLSATLVLSFSVTAPADFASAQDRYYYRRSIWDFFLGRRYIDQRYSQPPEVRRPPPQRQLRRRAAPPPPTRAAAAPVRPAAPVQQEPPVQKLQTAQKILIVGDFLASGLGDGMTEAFRTSPGVVVEARGNVSSGLVRDDYYDWPSQLLKMMDEVKPAMVVVMLGANDRQQMATDAGKEKFKTDGWYAEYQRRVVAFGKEVTSRKIPLLWVGLPAFESPSATTDAVQMNQLYRKQVEGVGGEFVDIWDGFVDENGQFIVTGSDINGQQVRLRTSDGINLTQAGRRKIAFYVEKPARRLLGIQASPDLVRLDTSNAPHLGQPSSPLGLPISLSDPNLDGGKELLGGMQPPASQTKSPRDMLVEDGKMEPAPAGRVDDYRLPSPKKPEEVSTK